MQDTNNTLNRSAWLVPLYISLKTFIIYLNRLLILGVYWKHIYNARFIYISRIFWSIQFDRTEIHHHQIFLYQCIITQKLTLPLSVPNYNLDHTPCKNSLYYQYQILNAPKKIIIYIYDVNNSLGHEHTGLCLAHHKNAI